MIGGGKATIFAQVGQLYSDEVGQYYSGANSEYRYCYRVRSQYERGSIGTVS